MCRYTNLHNTKKKKKIRALTVGKKRDQLTSQKKQWLYKGQITNTDIYFPEYSGLQWHYMYGSYNFVALYSCLFFSSFLFLNLGAF